MYPPPPPRVYRLKTDRPRRTGQGLKLTLAALLTALALQPDAVAQSFAVSNLGQRSAGTGAVGMVDPSTTSFTVGPPPEGFTGWTLDKITMAARSTRGNPSGFEARILNDDSGSPGLLDSPLATLTGPDPRGIQDYDFVPPAGTTISLEPETTYWLAYTSAGLPSNDNHYTSRWTNSVSEDAGTLSGWSIGDDYWWNDLSNGRWQTHRFGGNTRIPLQFSVFATPVPEPSEYALFFALGLGAFALWHRRRQAGQRTAG
ncbi:MAG: hypothetical protein M2R46_05150 [Verrucomicrobia subdivision 3 bacterium]|nr:hypothetical protein [Limisphaerales bacterium]